VNGPRVCSASVVIKDNKILLGLRAKGNDKNKWTIPGGKIEPFELMRDAAVRELKEETGIKIEIVKEIGVYEIIKKPYYHRIIVVWYAKHVSNKINVDGIEILAASFFSKDEIKALSLSPITEEILKDIGWSERNSRNVLGEE